MALHMKEPVIGYDGKEYIGEYRFNGKLFLYKFPIVCSQYIGSGAVLADARVAAAIVLNRELKKRRNLSVVPENSAAEDMLDDMHDSW